MRIRMYHGVRRRQGQARGRWWVLERWWWLGISGRRGLALPRGARRRLSYGRRLVSQAEGLESARRLGLGREGLLVVEGGGRIRKGGLGGGRRRGLLLLLSRLAALLLLLMKGGMS